METGNCIPLEPTARIPENKLKKKPKKVEGKTGEERVEMTKDAQLAAEIEKKKAKSDAKKHRKLNRILDRRMVVEEPADPVEVEKESKESKKPKKPKRSKTAAEAIVVESPPRKATPESKRAAPDAPAEEPKAKKSKKSKKSKSEDVEEVEEPVATTSKSEKKKKKKNHTSEPVVEAVLEPKLDEEEARKEKKRLKKEKKRQEEAAKVTEAAPGGETSSKKRKRSRNQDQEVEAPVEKAKSHNKKVKAAKPPSNGQPNAAAADQWNPDALTGDEARKAKFLRLLGAGKSNGAISDAVAHKPSAKVADINKVQSELERQYEMGMKMKHDGGGKRRGLGA